MKKKHSLLFCALFTIFTGHAESTDYTKGLSIWFDSPNTCLLYTSDAADE